MTPTEKLVTARSARRRSGLEETELLTLAVLQDHGTMCVGDILRLLGQTVRPAQMSKTLASLEARPKPLVSRQINLGDRRRIDVRLTPAGEQTLAEYEALTKILAE